MLKQEKKYVWFKDGAFEAIITDLVTLYKHPDFNSKEDKIYELGPEVKLEMTVKVIPAKPVTRDHSWENKE
jgi:hypothetical protein